MNWDILRLIAEKCNEGEQDVAVTLVKQQGGNISPHDACLIASAIDIRYLKDIVDILPDVGGVNDFRAKARIAMAKELKGEDYGNQI